MQLQRELENLDDLPEDLHENYEKGENGKFKLKLVKDLVPKGDEDQYVELRGALDNERKATAKGKEQLRELMGSLDALGGIDSLKDLVQAQADAEKSNLEKKGEYDKLLDQVKAENQSAITAKDETIKGLTARLDREIRGRQVAEAIASNEGNPNLLQPILMQATKLVGDPAAGEELRVEVHQGGTPLVDGEGKLLSVQAYVERLRQDDAYAGAFKGTGNTGGGGSGDPLPGGGPGGGGNGGGIPPELANFRRNTATPRQKVAMHAHLKTVHGDDQKAHDNAYFALPE